MTSRAHVHYVVTENGIAQLVRHTITYIALIAFFLFQWGKNMRQRAYELINIAHPSQRGALEKAAFERRESKYVHH